jgi:5-methylcytosine-specific restriction endonuclease McrA
MTYWMHLECVVIISKGDLDNKMRKISSKDSESSTPKNNKIVIARDKKDEENGYLCSYCNSTLGILKEEERGAIDVRYHS